MSIALLSKLVINDGFNFLHTSSRVTMAAIFGVTGLVCSLISFRFLQKLVMDAQKRLFVPFIITTGSSFVCMSYMYVIYAMLIEDVETYALGESQNNSIFCGEGMMFVAPLDFLLKYFYAD